MGRPATAYSRSFRHTCPCLCISFHHTGHTSSSLRSLPESIHSDRECLGVRTCYCSLGSSPCPTTELVRMVHRVVVLCSHMRFSDPEFLLDSVSIGYCRQLQLSCLQQDMHIRFGHTMLSASHVMQSKRWSYCSHPLCESVQESMLSDSHQPLVLCAQWTVSHGVISSI